MSGGLIALLSLLKFLPKHLSELKPKTLLWSWLTLNSHQQYYYSHNDNNIYILFHAEQLAFEAPEDAVNFSIFSFPDTENMRAVRVLHLKD